MNRYSLMESTASGYPDSLSYDPKKIDIRHPVRKIMLDMTSIQRVDFLFHSVYGTQKYREIVLDYNGVAHTDELEVGQILSFPSSIDLEKYMRESIK